MQPDYRELYETLSKKIDREWSSRLKPATQSVLRFILDRTVGEGQQAALVQVAHFDKGIVLGDALLRSGCGVSTRVARRSLSTLEKMGAIRRRVHRDGWIIALQLEAGEGGLMALAVSKKRLEQGGQKGQASPCVFGRADNVCNTKGLLLSKRTTSDQDRKAGRPKRAGLKPDEIAPTPDTSARMDMVMDEAMARANEVRARKLAQARKKLGPIGTRATALWTRLCLHVHGTACREKKKDMAVLASHARHFKGEDFMDMLEWSLRNWAAIMSARFAWMDADAIPELPSVSLFVRFSDKFQQGYRDRDRLTREAGMTDREREIARCLRKGMTQEAAERTADEKLGLATERQKLEQAKKDIQRERAALAMTPIMRMPALPKTAPSPLKQFQKRTTKKGKSPFGAWED
jgi:hypothetical protein